MVDDIVCGRGFFVGVIVVTFVSIVCAVGVIVFIVIVVVGVVVGCVYVLIVVVSLVWWTIRVLDVVVGIRCLDVFSVGATGCIHVGVGSCAVYVEFIIVIG